MLPVIDDFGSVIEYSDTPLVVALFKDPREESEELFRC